MIKLAANQQFSENGALKYAARTSFVLSTWIIVQRDYLCDLGTAMSKAADCLRFGSQALSRFSEISGVRLRELCLHLIGQVVQDADAVLCGLQSRYMQKYQMKYSMERFPNTCICTSMHQHICTAVQRHSCGDWTRSCTIDQTAEQFVLPNGL